jgi:hypothetical protein
MVHWSLLLPVTGRLWNQSKFVLTLTHFQRSSNLKRSKGENYAIKTLLVTETVWLNLPPCPTMVPMCRIPANVLKPWKMYEHSNYTPRALQSRSAWYSHSLFKSRQTCPNIPPMATCRHFLWKISSKRFVFFVSSRLLERHRRVFYNFWKMIWPLDKWLCSVVNVLKRSRKRQVFLLHGTWVNELLVTPIRKVQPLLRRF